MLKQRFPHFGPRATSHICQISRHLFRLFFYQITMKGSRIQQNMQIIKLFYEIALYLPIFSEWVLICKKGQMNKQNFSYLETISISMSSKNFQCIPKRFLPCMDFGLTALAIHIYLRTMLTRPSLWTMSTII